MTDRKNRRDFLCDGMFLTGALWACGVCSAQAVEPSKPSKPDGGPLKVGAFAMDVTPQKFPVAVNGGFSPRYYESANDPLYTRVIIVDDGTQSFVFATIDVCLFPASFSDRILELASKKTGIPKERISISATHTHFAPGLFGKVYTDYNKEYIDWLVVKSADAIGEAHKRMTPARFAWTTAREPRHVFCRRILMKPGTAWDEPAPFTDAPRNLAQMNPGKGNPNIVSRTAFPDQTIYMLAFESPDGKPLALLANYSTHYAGNPTAVSADYFGVFAREIKSMLKADDRFVAMMTNGTSGDMNCIDFLDKDQPKFDWEIVGKHVAEKTFEAYKKLKFVDHAPVRSTCDVLRIPIRKPTPEQVAEAKEYLKKYENDPKVKVTSKAYARRTIGQVDSPDFSDVRLQAVRIADFGICTIPSEVFSFTGHDLRAYTPFATNMIIGLANGYNGYLPTADQFELGGYTTWRGTSYLERNAEPQIRAKLLAMLKTLHDAN